ncbi:MAG: hypothetical protein LBG92_11700, partial [Prevotellaceae bacterium]|nr:hypothetical protein [Prevotellaceae bacterium]
MKNILRIFLSVLSVWFAELNLYGADTVMPVELSCEYLDSPLGIDIVQPRLSWKITQTGAAVNGIVQTAYRIIVASSPEKLNADEGDLWNSGKVTSNSSVHVIYSGKKLS